VFIGKKIPPSSINITCSAVSKFISALITDFNFTQTKFIKNIKKGFMTNNQISSNVESRLVNILSSE
jgi:uncharacterized protein YsxB (DUF464 family)